MGHLTLLPPASLGLCPFSALHTEGDRKRVVDDYKIPQFHHNNKWANESHQPPHQIHSATINGSLSLAVSAVSFGLQPSLVHLLLPS